ncbi:glycosyl hydrolase 53 family protein [Streptomyces sp. NPDC057363]|uniref:glycosyl hydrolase 53 family protein n=1 Tax=Streptomyces sp. NPDC057363 TaxID=3346107 RepID=UPI003634A442
MVSNEINPSHCSTRRPLLSRRTFTAGALAAGVGMAVAPAVNAAAAPGVVGSAARRGGFRNALSVSPFTEAVIAQAALSDGRLVARTVPEVHRLFMRHGGRELYARIATKRVAPQGAAEHGWDRGLERARLARALGVPFNPEIGLFANYGDTISYQDPPDFRDYPQIAAHVNGPWTGLTLNQMVQVIRLYTATIAKQIRSTGAQVEYWDLGNEVENGIAGVTPQPIVPSPDPAVAYAPPDAVDPAIGQMTIFQLQYQMPEAERIAWSRQHLWPYMAALFAAARDGIRSVDRRAKFSTHISLSNMTTPAVPLAFWTTMRDNGYLPDELGVSFYPTVGSIIPGAPPVPDDRFAVFKDIHLRLRAEFGRKVFIAEYAYPSANGSLFDTPTAGYAINPADQVRFTRDLVEWGRRTDVLAGIRWWAPDFVMGSEPVGWNPLALFDPVVDGTSTAKPAIDAIRP